MQGEWELARVRTGAGEVKVEVLDPDGRRIDHWTLTYTDPDHVD